MSKPELSKGAICKSHGLAVLATHVNDGEPCTDYLSIEHEPVVRGGEGEWRTVDMTDTGFDPRPCWTIEQEGQPLLATAYSENVARQIVTEHNQHHSLLAGRERLREALKGVAIMLNTELEKYNKEPWAQRVRAALNDQKGE